MGSALQVEGKTVWLSYWALLWGGLKRLHMGAREVEPTDVLDDFYGPLLEFLAHSHRVEIFPYDWRRSVRDAASELADRLEAWLPQAERNQQAVHLVAHSMGGLVVRAMIADGGRGAALWRRIVALPNSRFMMLGTPNLGSYEAVRWLTGCNPTQTKLSLLDLTQSGSDIVDLVRNFPGLVELLPFDGDSPDFSQRGLWKDLKDALHARWQPAEEQVLRQAQITWAQLKAAAPEPEHMVYVAGCQPATVTDYQLRDYEQDPDEGRSLAGLKRLQFMGVQQGDGTVTWKSGLLPGVPVWYVHDTAHDELCKQRSALPAYLDLLATGTTTRLAATPPAARAVTGAAQSFPMPAIPHTDDIPDERAARSLGFGPGRPFETDDRPAVPVIRVRMSHGDLAYARYPVLVGHYLGDTIIGAEAALNDRLGGVLEQRLQLGLYPERLRSHALFFNDDAHGSPAGAIVIGLGQVGELTSGLLEGGLRSALLDYALQVAQWQDDRFGPASGVRSAALSCLLVGSGPGGVMVRESVEAILRGAVAANEQLVAAGLDSRVLVDQIEFLELYEDVALSAAEALDTILDSGQLAGAVRWPEKVIEPGQGRRRRVRAGEAPGWWQRLEIVEEKASGGLRFIALTNRARAEVTQSSGQLQLADRFVSEASRSASSHSDIAKTLFEILLPNRLKQMAPDQRDMVLLVDSASARYPWEMLEDRWSQSGRPIAVAAGMVRQLKTPAFRAHPAHASGATAFVVGNPNLGGWQAFADLPGARQEARTVTELLRSSGYRVNDCIDAKAGAIVDGLHQDSWRILHLAGHGEYQMLLEDDDDSAQLCADGEGPIVKCERRITGMVIGDHTFLTPGDVEQMRWVPEVVFINCCHLGKTGASARGHYGLLAANLGVQFINMGVKVVVAAGWAVDDAAASAFAERFYSQLLRGETFGEAVRVARQEIWSRFPGVNTWGAYQCYGDPGYRLQGDGAAPRRSTVQRYYAPAELIAKLENYTEALRVASKNPDDEQQVLATMRKEIVELYGSIAEEQRSQWLGRADVAAAVGFAWGETGAWEEAVEWLEKALAATAGDCPVRVLEQCANFRVRLAFERWQQSADLVDADQGEVVRAASISDIERAIMELDYIAQRAPTAERLNLLGSACKRLARMCGEQEHRLEALVNMAAYYRRAIDQDDRPDPYPFSNWAIAKLLALRFDPNLSAQWPADLQDEYLRMIDAARVRNEARPNFWDGVGQADCELVLLLTAPNITLEQAGARASCIAELYRGAAKRGVSPREYASVLEHLEFIVALGEFPTGSPLEVALAAIRGAL
jgi:CHAT domain-containing protein